MSTAETSTDCMSMPTTEAHERFKPFVGTFNATVKMYMGPGEPHESTGEMTNELILGGRYLNQEYVGNDDGGPFPDFAGRGYWGFNTVTNKYEGVWIDNACTFMQNEVGDVDDSGKVWTMVGTMTNPETGKPMQKRSVITLVDDDHHTMEMFFEGPDGNEAKTMEIEYARK